MGNGASLSQIHSGYSDEVRWDLHVDSALGGLLEQSDKEWLDRVVLFLHNFMGTETLNSANIDVQGIGSGDTDLTNEVDGVGVVEKGVGEQDLVHQVGDRVTCATKDSTERHVVIISELRSLDVALFHVQGELLKEELRKLAHFFSHLETHNLAAALNLGHRVASGQTGKGSIIDIKAAKLCAQIAEVRIGRLGVEVLSFEALLLNIFLLSLEFCLTLTLKLALGGFGKSCSSLAVFFGLLLGLLVSLLLLSCGHLLRWV